MGITSAALARLSLASGNDSTTKQHTWPIFSPDHLDWSGHPGLSSDHVGCPPGTGQLCGNHDIQHQLACCPGEQRHHQWRRTPRLREWLSRLGRRPIELCRPDGHGMDFPLPPRPQGAVLWDSRRVLSHSRWALNLDNKRSALATTRTELLCDDRNASRTQSDRMDNRPSGSR